MRKLAVIAALCAALAFGTLPLAAQDKPADKPQAKPPAPVWKSQEWRRKPRRTLRLPAKKAVDPNAGRTVEEIIARVNNEIITRSEFERARQTAEEDAKQECQGRCTPEQLKADIDGREKTTLRDLIDQSLLVQRAKDMGISVEPELIKRLDQIRIENKLASMEELEKAVSAPGIELGRFQEQHPQHSPDAARDQQRSWFAHHHQR